MTLVYITCKNEKEAVKISTHLLNKRLIACSNMFPIKSMYWWGKKIENTREFAVLAKTKEKNYNAIKKEVENIHSYKIPCILKISVKSNKAYEQWANNELK